MSIWIYLTIPNSDCEDGSQNMYEKNDYIYSRIREILNDAKANGDISEKGAGNLTYVLPFGKELKLKPLWYGWNRSQRID